MAASARYTGFPMPGNIFERSTNGDIGRSVTFLYKVLLHRTPSKLKEAVPRGTPAMQQQPASKQNPKPSYHNPALTYGCYPSAHSQDDAATAPFAFFECQQGRSCSCLEHVVYPFTRQRRAFQIFPRSNLACGGTPFIICREVKGFLSHLFLCEWVFS